MSLVVIVLTFLVANALIQDLESLPLPVVTDELGNFNTSIQEHSVKVVKRNVEVVKETSADSESTDSEDDDDIEDDDSETEDEQEVPPTEKSDTTQNKRKKGRRRLKKRPRKGLRPKCRWAICTKK